MRLHIWAFLILLSGCASSAYRDLDDIRPGMDKDLVLQHAGNPKRTFRSNGQDHWIYVFFQNGQEMNRQVDFADGKVLRVGRASAKQNLERALENAETMEEFESKARAHQRNSSGFKNIDGGSTHANGE